MAEFPAIPFWTDAYIGDTMHLTTLQHGAYLLLLVAAWRSPDCSLPDDDIMLARITRMDKRTWKANRDTILSFWSRGSDAKLFQKRLKDERKYVEDKRNKNAAAGTASALKRLNRGSTNVQPNGNVNPTPTPTPTPIPTPIATSSPTPYDKFEQAEAALRAVPGIADHPVSTVPGIAPIWKLIQQGYDLKTQIIPSIRDQLARRPKGRPIKAWNYFVPGIVESVQGAASASPVAVSDEWPKRLAWAREHRAWSYKAWGPAPKEPGCKVPPDLLQHGDGVAWTEWEAA